MIARGGGRDRRAGRPGALRAQVQRKYREVALEPDARSTSTPAGGWRPGSATPRRRWTAAGRGRGVVRRGGQPVRAARLQPGERVVDVGCGAGFDTFLAAAQVGPTGRVVGVDMTAEMLAKARRTAAELGLDHVEIREGLAEALPVEDGWADVVISNGVINLCADKAAVFAEIRRVLRPGGGCSSPTSPTADRCPPPRCATSTCGPVESPAGCPVRAGRRCSNDPGSSGAVGPA